MSDREEFVNFVGRAKQEGKTQQVFHSVRARVLEDIVEKRTCTLGVATLESARELYERLKRLFEDLSDVRVSFPREYSRTNRFGAMGKNRIAMYEITISRR